MNVNGYDDALTVVIELNQDDIFKLRNGEIIYDASFIKGYKRLIVECHCSETDNALMDD